jgi:hypothetical protein
VSEFVGQQRRQLIGRQLLAVTLQVQEKWTGAEEHFRQALQLCEEYLAPIHPELANVLEQYAELLSLMAGAAKRTTTPSALARSASSMRRFQGDAKKKPTAKAVG